MSTKKQMEVFALKGIYIKFVCFLRSFPSYLCANKCNQSCRIRVSTFLEKYTQGCNCQLLFWPSSWGSHSRVFQVILPPRSTGAEAWDQPRSGHVASVTKRLCLPFQPLTRVRRREFLRLIISPLQDLNKTRNKQSIKWASKYYIFFW